MWPIKIEFQVILIKAYILDSFMNDRTKKDVNSNNVYQFNLHVVVAVVYRIWRKLTKQDYWNFMFRFK